MKEIKALLGDNITRKLWEMWKELDENPDEPVTMFFNDVRIIMFKDKQE